MAPEVLLDMANPILRRKPHNSPFPTLLAGRQAGMQSLVSATRLCGAPQLTWRPGCQSLLVFRSSFKHALACSIALPHRGPKAFASLALFHSATNGPAMSSSYQYLPCSITGLQGAVLCVASVLCCAQQDNHCTHRENTAAAVYGAAGTALA